MMTGISPVHPTAARSPILSGPLEFPSAACGRNQTWRVRPPRAPAISFQRAAFGAIFITSPRDAEKLRRNKLSAAGWRCGGITAIDDDALALCDVGEHLRLFRSDTVSTEKGPGPIRCRNHNVSINGMEVCWLCQVFIRTRRRDPRLWRDRLN